MSCKTWDNEKKSIIYLGDRWMAFSSQVTLIWKPVWVGGEGHDGEEETHITYLLLSVQYCVPHRCFGSGQGGRNEIRTIFLQVFLFLQPITHRSRMQWCLLVAKQPASCLLLLCLETMSRNRAFYSDGVYIRLFSTKGRARAEMSTTWLSMYV